MDEWYYTKMGLQQGPVPKVELLAKIRRGDVGESNLVWTEGLDDWLPPSKVSALHPEPAAAPVDPCMPPTLPQTTEASVAPSAPSMGSIPIAQPPAYHGDYLAPNIPSYLVPSIVAMVLSVLSMLLYCLAPGVITGIVAIVYATKVDALKVQGNFVAADSASKTAKVWMIVTYSLLGLPILAGIGLLVFALLQ